MSGHRGHNFLIKEKPRRQEQLSTLITNFLPYYVIVDCLGRGYLIARENERYFERAECECHAWRMCQRAVIRLWRNLEKWCVPAGYFHSYTHWHSHYPDTTWHVCWPSGKLSSSGRHVHYLHQGGWVSFQCGLFVCLSVCQHEYRMTVGLIFLKAGGNSGRHCIMERIHKLFPNNKNFTKPKSDNFQPCQWQQKCVFSTSEIYSYVVWCVFLSLTK